MRVDRIVAAAHACVVERAPARVVFRADGRVHAEQLPRHLYGARLACEHQGGAACTVGLVEPRSYAARAAHTHEAILC
eukprot:4427070-Prymnesium_polylepis.1